MLIQGGRYEHRYVYVKNTRCMHGTTQTFTLTLTHTHTSSFRMASVETELPPRQRARARRSNATKRRSEDRVIAAETEQSDSSSSDGDDDTYRLPEPRRRSGRLEWKRRRRSEVVRTPSPPPVPDAPPPLVRQRRTYLSRPRRPVTIVPSGARRPVFPARRRPRARGSGPSASEDPLAIASEDPLALLSQSGLAESSGPVTLPGLESLQEYYTETQLALRTTRDTGTIPGTSITTDNFLPGGMRDTATRVGPPARRTESYRTDIDNVLRQFVSQVGGFAGRSIREATEALRVYDFHPGSFAPGLSTQTVRVLTPEEFDQIHGSGVPVPFPISGAGGNNDTDRIKRFEEEVKKMDSNTIREILKAAPEGDGQAPQKTCAICLEDMVEPDEKGQLPELAMFPGCGAEGETAVFHIFCRHCLISVAKSATGAKCPLCRHIYK